MRWVEINVNGILARPGHAESWTDRAVTLAHLYYPSGRAEKFEYASGLFTRHIFQDRRAEALAALANRYLLHGWRVHLRGHSNGCDVICRAIRHITSGNLGTVQLIAPACPASFQDNGLNEALQTGRVERVVICGSGDDKSRTIMERAFSMATRLGGLVVSTETDVEIKQAASQSAGEAFEKFHAIAQREKSKLILGQTLSADAQATGMGSGVADAQGKVRDDIRTFDARMLAHTIRTQLFAQLVRINGLPGTTPIPSWGGEDSEDLASLGEFLSSLNTAGLTVSDDSLETLSERVGLTLQRLPAPAPGGFPFSVTPLAAAAPSYGQIRAAQADAANDRIAREGSADLARAFRGALAPVRQIILDSTSPEDLERRLRAHYADWKPGKVAALLEQALTAYAANGVIR